MRKMYGSIMEVHLKDFALLKENPDEFWRDVQFIGMEAFSNTGITKIDIPENIIKIGSNAFDSCEKLEAVNLPNELYEIGCGAFSYCEMLKSITIPKSVNELGAKAFNNCTRLKNVTFNGELKEIEESTFEDCASLENIILPRGLITIGRSAFCRCSSIKELKLPSTVAEINDGAFSGCTGLEKIVLPKFVKVAEKVFWDCDFNYIYTLKGQNVQVLSKDMPENLDDVSGLVDLRPIKKAFIGFDYGKVLNGGCLEELQILAQKLNKYNLKLPFSFIMDLERYNKLFAFSDNADFKYFVGEFSEADLYKKHPMFFNLAYDLGCFSNEHMVDDYGRPIETRYAQKASSTLRQIIQKEDIVSFYTSFKFQLSEPSEICDQEFLNFIGQKNGEEFPNVKLLIDLENENPGIFFKVMKDFKKAKKYRQISVDGKIKTVPWRQALIDFSKYNVYDGVGVNDRELASLYLEHHMSELAFQNAKSTMHYAKSKKIPEHILDIHLKEETILDQITQIQSQTELELEKSSQLIEQLYEKQFSYEWLAKNDPLNCILGIKCGCCAVLGGGLYYGGQIAAMSIKSKNVQNLVVRDRTGEIIAKGALYIDRKHGFGVINEFDINIKYRGNEMFEGTYYDDFDKKSSHNKKREAILNAFMRGVMDFVKAYDYENPDNPIKKINVGMGHNKLNHLCSQFRTETKLLTVPAKYEFLDALDGQYVLYDRNEQIRKTRKELEKLK